MLPFIDSDNDNPMIRTTGTTNVIISGLAKYTNYSVQVAAFTQVGSGPSSPSIYCQTEEDGKKKGRFPFQLAYPYEAGVTVGNGRRKKSFKW